MGRIFKLFFKEDFFMYDILHCFIFRPSDFIVSEDAGIEPRPVATPALAARRSISSKKSHSKLCMNYIGEYCPLRRSSGGDFDHQKLHITDCAPKSPFSKPP